jgi:hypothetical protein
MEMQHVQETDRSKQPPFRAPTPPNILRMEGSDICAVWHTTVPAFRCFEPAPPAPSAHRSLRRLALDCHSRSSLQGCETTMMNLTQVYIKYDDGLRGDQSLGSILTFSEPSDQ